MITVIHPTGAYFESEPAGEPTLEQLQEWVGGYIEVPGGGFIVNGEEIQFVCNEEGKLEGLPVNPEATRRYHDAVRAGNRGEFALNDVLVGTIVILTAPHLLT